MPYIMVQNHMNLSWDTCSSVPFSWRIRDYLEELWIQAQYITGAEGEPRGPVEMDRSRKENQSLCRELVAPVRRLLCSWAAGTREVSPAEPFSAGIRDRPD